MAVDVELPLSFRCAKCGEAQAHYVSISRLAREDVECCVCGVRADRLAVLADTIAGSHYAGALFGALGASTRQFTARLTAGMGTMIDLHAQGVPPSARVLAVAYVPNEESAWHPPPDPPEGALFPIEHHDLFPLRKVPQRHITLFPRPVPPTSNAVTTDVLVSVYWVEVPSTDVAWSSLVDAFEAFFAEDYVEALVPANVAVEARLTPLIRRYLVEKVGLSRVRLKELDRDLTYSLHLDVLLPVIACLAQGPPINTQVLDQLHVLRKLRNQLVHRAAPERPLDRKQVATLLAASVLALDHMRTLETAWFSVDASPDPLQQ